jgi:hypothetical protein
VQNSFCLREADEQHTRMDTSDLPMNAGNAAISLKDTNGIIEAQQRTWGSMKQVELPSLAPDQSLSQALDSMVAAGHDLYARPASKQGWRYKAIRCSTVSPPPLIGMIGGR